MSVILPQSSVKPAMWPCDLGTIAYNCAQMDIPIPKLVVPMWEKSGETFNYSGENNNGVLAGNADWVPGGLYFDGVAGSYLTFSDEPLSLLSNCSLVMGFSFPDIPGEEYIFVHELGTSWKFVIVYYSADWRFRTRRNGLATIDDLDFGSFINTNEFANWAFTFDGVNDSKAVYKNGVLATSKTPTAHGAGVVDTGDACRLAHGGWAGLADGKFAVNYLYLFDETLNSVQVQAVHNNPYGIFKQAMTSALWSIPSVGVAPTGALYGPFGGNFMGPI